MVSLACTHPDPPASALPWVEALALTEGSDLLLFDLGDRYLVEAASEKGKALLGGQAF